MRVPIHDEIGVSTGRTIRMMNTQVPHRNEYLSLLQRIEHTSEELLGEVLHVGSIKVSQVIFGNSTVT